LMETITFQKALEIIESLPEEQRESLIDIVKRRLIEERRDRLAQRIGEACQGSRYFTPPGIILFHPF
jgi:U3 small nucleolar ribonucleoprotein component